ncbi:hypothetical protein DENSPDRAFT_835507 [Dentipellis sp. KUC8613]|nr:hypothetical protein DENSPDRAFT_835507 [Dentipellis sp. KUC8613]
MLSKDKSSGSRRLGWRTRHSASSSKDATSPLVPPKEGEELTSYTNTSHHSSAASLSSPSTTNVATVSSSNNSSPNSSRPTTPLFSARWSSPNILTKPLQSESQNAQSLTTALERTQSKSDTNVGKFPSAPAPELTARSSGSFGRMSFSSMMGGLSALSLTRSSEDKDKDKKEERGRSLSLSRSKERARSSSTASQAMGDDNSSFRSRSSSPFRMRRRARDPSPAVGALTHSDVESDTEPSRMRVRNAYAASDDESQDGGESEEESDEEEWSDVDQFDPVTERNTERNALVVPQDMPDADGEIIDPTGEGVNVVIPPEPYFPTTLNQTRGRNPRRRKSTRHEPLPLHTSRPVFMRDRCAITITHGDPEKAVSEGRRTRKYVVASDLSDESRYAVEWGIGTVLRDGDEMLVVHVVENESKVDPPVPNAADRAAKLRSQQERQGLAYILCRQVTSLLQRTRLNVTIICEAWHAKNARHMLLDIVDHIEPVMLIVGSRGLGQLKGILLGSTSHYLIQKCSVPVMVARRRLKRPPRRSAHLAKHRARVSLAEAAGIERVTPRVDEDVANMRSEIERDEQRETGGIGVQFEGEADEEDEGEDKALGQKVAGD